MEVLFIFCPKCGANLSPDYNFCQNCGAALIKNDIAENTPLIEQESVTDTPVEGSVTTPEITEQQPSATNQEINTPTPDYQPINTNSFYQPNSLYPPQFPNPIIDPGRDFSIASLVLGIVSYLLLCAFVLGWPGTFACTITGIVLGAKARKKSRSVGIDNGIALAGIITSSIALAMVTAICLIYVFLFIFAVDTMNTEIFSELI